MSRQITLSLVARRSTPRRGHAACARPARCEEANLRTDVIRVDQRARIVAWRLGAATLLGRDRLRAPRKAGNSESDLATVTGRQLRGLRVERSAGDRGH